MASGRDGIRIPNTFTKDTAGYQNKRPGIPGLQRLNISMKEGVLAVGATFLGKPPSTLDLPRSLALMLAPIPMRPTSLPFAEIALSSFTIECTDPAAGTPAEIQDRRLELCISFLTMLHKHDSSFPLEYIADLIYTAVPDASHEQILTALHTIVPDANIASAIYATAEAMSMEFDSKIRFEGNWLTASFSGPKPSISGDKSEGIRVVSFPDPASPKMNAQVHEISIQMTGPWEEQMRQLMRFDTLLTRLLPPESTGTPLFPAP